MKYALLLVACAAAAAGAQTPAPSARLDRVEAWLDAVETHQAGVDDAAVARIAAWARTDLQALLIDLTAVRVLIRDPDATVFMYPFRGANIAPQAIVYDRHELARLQAVAARAGRRGSANDLMKRAAMLHADAAALRFDARPATTESPRGSFTLHMDDGQRLGYSDGFRHWDIGRALLDAITPTPAGDPFVRQWYRATMSLLLVTGRLHVGQFNRGAALFPVDADILLLNGALHESLASRPVQDATPSGPFSTLDDVKGEGEELQLAEGYLRRALEASPRLAEARLRLGRVLGLRGRHAEAARELATARGDAREPRIEFYAALFLGREAETLARLDEAAQAYGRAAELFPRAQSARLAVSQLQSRRGNGAAAVRAVAVALLSGSDLQDDPWWTYHPSAGRHAAALLAELAKLPVERAR